MKQNTKKEKGITLVALIITIVILLILAVVSIGAIKNSSIIAHSQNAASGYTIAQEKEILQIAVDEWQIKKNIPDNAETFKQTVEEELNKKTENGEITIQEFNEGTLLIKSNKTDKLYMARQGKQVIQVKETLEFLVNTFILIRNNEEVDGNDFEAKYGAIYSNDGALSFFEEWIDDNSEDLYGKLYNRKRYLYNFKTGEFITSEGDYEEDIEFYYVDIDDEAYEILEKAKAIKEYLSTEFCSINEIENNREIIKNDVKASDITTWELDEGIEITFHVNSENKNGIEYSIYYEVVEDENGIKVYYYETFLGA